LFCEAKQKKLATAAAPNEKGLLQFEENFSALLYTTSKPNL
jgi:hypothetical protein